MFQDKSTLISVPGVFGIQVDVAPSLLMLGFIFVMFGVGGGTLWALTIFAMLVVSIYLHELGHAWACRVQNVPVKRIMLTGGGGFCEQSRSATRPQQELIVAMGPIVNLSLWAVATLLVWQVEQTLDAGTATEILLRLYPYLYVFGLLNLALALFNLMPVQPLDGGKILHLFLVRFMPLAQATRLTGGIGFVFAILWWPALIWFYLTSGWLLFFAPSIRGHWRMMRGS